MRIDTVHQSSQSVVVITTCSAQERALSDDEWKRVAFNQHRLLWQDGASGTAVLPRRIVGTMPPEGTRVERSNDQVRVFMPLDF